MTWLRTLIARFRRTPLPADPFGEPGAGFAMTDAERDLNGTKFVGIANRV